MRRARRHLLLLFAGLSTTVDCHGDNRPSSSTSDGSVQARLDGGGDMSVASTPDATAGDADGQASVDAGHTTWGAGTSIYQRNSLVLLSEPGAAPVRIAARVFGLSTIEVLTENQQGGFDPTALQAPPAVTSGAQAPVVPLALAAADVDLDGRNDLLVSSSLGHWFWPGSADGTYGASATNELTSALDGLDASVGGLSDCLEIDGTPGQPMLASFCDGGAFYTTAYRTTGWDSLVLEQLPPWRLHNLISISRRTITLPANGTDPISLVYESSFDLRLVRYVWTAEGALSAIGAMTQTPLSPPYLEPFDGFDHIQNLNLDGCPPSAVGVGVFSGVKGAPRQIEQIKLTGTTTYVTQEIPTAFDVTTLAVATAGDGETVIAALGQSDFAAYRITACDQWTSIAAGSTDFDWRAPPAPSFGANGPDVPKTNGVQILGTWSTESADAGNLDRFRFFHYDGYDLRTWEVDLVDHQSITGAFSFRRTPIHEDRNDFTF